MRIALSQPILMGLVLLIAACSFGKTGLAPDNSGALVKGTVSLPSRLMASYRVADGNLAESAVAGAQVQLLTRSGQSLKRIEQVSTDSAGRFTLTQADGDGVYLVEALVKGRYRLRSFVRVRSGTTAETLLNAASSLLTDRMARTRLTFTGLDVAKYNGIVAQAHSLIAESDAPDFSNSAAVTAGGDAYLGTHATIRQQLDVLLSEEAAAEGMAGDPTAILPVNASPSATASTSPTPSPEPTFTPEPVPRPSNESFTNVAPMQAMSTRSVDSPPTWIEAEGRDLLWASCPASNSIVRFERSDPTWIKHYPMSPHIGGAFMPGQLAVLANPESPNAPAVWVGNNHPQGTKVAIYSLLGNFLGSVDTGALRPSAISLDNYPLGRHIWIGANGDSDGKIVVTDMGGTVLKTGQTAPHPFRFLSHFYDPYYYMWIVTPHILYRIVVNGLADSTSLVENGNGNKIDLTNAGSPLLRNPIRAMTLDSSGDPWLVFQDDNYEVGTMVHITASKLPSADSLSPEYSFPTSTRVVSVIADGLDDFTKWVATQNEVIRLKSGDILNPNNHYSQSRTLFGIFPGGIGPVIWGALDSPPEVQKLPLTAP